MLVRTSPCNVGMSRDELDQRRLRDGEEDEASQLDGCGAAGVCVGSASVCGDVADVRVHAGERRLAGVRVDGATNVEDIQLGIYTYGRSRTMRWDGDWYCLRGTSSIPARSATG